jgi:hypothetical protein
METVTYTVRIYITTGSGYSRSSVTAALLALLRA